LAERFDVAVIGLGAVGSAAAFELTRRGARIAGFDAYAPPHAMGSSHGETRVVRIAYAEGEAYVPMARRAVALWLEANARSGQTLFHQDGVLYAGPRTGTMIAGVLASAKRYGVAVEPRGAIGAKAAPAGWSVVFEPEGGHALCEAAVAWWLDQAREAGAHLNTNTSVTALRRTAGGWRIEAGERSCEAETVLVAAGGWAGRLREALAPLVSIERRVHTWFDPAESGVVQGGHPAFAFQDESGVWFYGGPAIAGGRGVKLSPHHADAPVRSADAVDRGVTSDDGARSRDFAPRVFDGLGPVIDQEACFYTMSPDGHFIIEDALAREGLIAITGLSGHGFKFAPALGEHAALRLLGGPGRLDLAAFSPARFS